MTYPLSQLQRKQMTAPIKLNVYESLQMEFKRGDLLDLFFYDYVNCERDRVVQKIRLLAMVRAGLRDEDGTMVLRNGKPETDGREKAR